MFERLPYRRCKRGLASQAGIGLLWFVRFAAADTCDATLAARLPVFEKTFDVGGGDRIERRLLLPASMDVLVIASERGSDVRLEVKQGSSVIAASDNPIFRSGVQRAAFRTTPDASYSLDIVSKEYTKVRGQVDVRVLAYMSREPVNPCVDVNRKIAAADAQFATGQLVTLGLMTNSGTDAAMVYKASAEAYAALATSLAESGPSALLAEVQHAESGALYWGVQDWEASCMTAEQAMRSYAAIGSPFGEAKARALLAAALMETAPSTKVTCGIAPEYATESRTQRIRRLLISAAGVHERRGELFDQAVALNDLGLAYRMDDDFPAAIATFERARKLYERVGETVKLAQVLQNTALANYGLGRLSTALPLYSRALSLLQPKQDPTLYAVILNNSALANTFAGDHDAALRQLGEALSTSRAVQDRWWQVTILDNIGLVYGRIGETDLALDFYGQSLTLADEALISSGRRMILSKMATILRGKGEYGRAVALRKEALGLAQAPSDKTFISIQLAADYRAAGEFGESARLLQAILNPVGGSLSDFHRALALLEKGRLASAQQVFSQAEVDYREALRIFHSLDIPEQELSASLGLAQALNSRPAPQEALHELTRTLQLAEELRLQSANPELRAKLLEASRPAFDLKIAILADRYFAERQEALRQQLALEALQTSEQARARALVDFTRLDMAANGISPELQRERESSYAELSARRQRLAALLEVAAPDNPRVAVVRGDIATLRQRLNDIDARLAKASIQPTIVETPWTFDARAIPEDAAVIAYWLGKERAFAWALTRDRVSLIDLGDSADITSAALALHRALRGLVNLSANDRLQLSEQLDRVVFAPVRTSVSNKKALTIVADGALHYIPFAVLRTRWKEQARYLIEDHDLANAPSIRTLTESKQLANSVGNRMLLVADPRYQAADRHLATSGTDSGSTIPLVRGSANLHRLPGTALEAAAIREFFPKHDIDILAGARATRDQFLSMDLRSYRFIHIASHAVADSEIPQLSAIILSTVDDQGKPINGRVLAADLLNLRFDTELLVLSGCETALGRSVAGEGLVGLQYVMLARGARNVLSSLWEVPDQKTGELMSRLYTAMLSDELTPRQSLASAMRFMLARGSDPGMWGAFAVTTTDLNDRMLRTSIHKQHDKSRGHHEQE